VRCASSATHSRSLATFHDQGRGVPPGLREAIFEPFFTTRAGGAGSTSEDNVGSRLGLFVSKMILERWGGWFVVADDSRRIATFSVRLPLIDPEVIARTADAPRLTATFLVTVADTALGYAIKTVLSCTICDGTMQRCTWGTRTRHATR